VANSWSTDGLSLLRPFYSLVPVKTVQLGEAATLTCALPIKEFGSITVHWYKQSAGDGLKLIVTLSKSAPPEYSPEFSRKRFHVENANNVSNLTVLMTVQEDEGIYHCGIAEWMYPIQWSETYLSVKGKTDAKTFSLCFCSATGTIRIHSNANINSLFGYFGHWKCLSINIFLLIFQIEADDQLNYAALNFSERKTRGRRKRDITEDSVYSQVKS
uniref:Ig-like domain-containing protein n=1 Tax=Neolamprologus brichardi TaxID=32507 RepID=A0A3Q4H8X5_NEOBR